MSYKTGLESNQSSTLAIRSLTRMPFRSRVPLMLFAVAGLAVTALQAVPIIQYQVTTLGPAGGGLTSYRYNYSLSGFNLLANQEVDIRFDPTVYVALSNGVAPATFDLLLFQPNSSPGEPGDYSALAKVNNPSTSGTFSVDFTFKGVSPPGSQPFFIYDDNPAVSVLLFSGVTSPAGMPGVPEPRSFVLCGLIMVLGGARWVTRRRTRSGFSSQNS